MVPPLRVGHVGSVWAYRARLGVAGLLSLYTVLLAAAMARAAILGGGPDLAWTFFGSGVLLLALCLVLPRAWRWALTTKPRVPAPVLDADADADREPPRHLGLSGDVEPPTRW